MPNEDAISSQVVYALVVNYNTGPRLIECVRALLSEPGITLIWVVDNASHDGSVEALEAECSGELRLRVIRNPTNIGFGAANNIALRQVRGCDWILINPDCLLRAGSLQAFVACRSAHPRAGLLGGLVLNPDGTEQRGCRRDLPGVWASLLRSLWLGRILPKLTWTNFDYVGTPVPTCPIQIGATSGALMYLKSEALKDIGEFDEGYFLHCEDLDICKRMADGGWEVWFVPGSRAVHFQGTSSRYAPFKVEWHKHRSMWRYFNKFQRPASSVLLVPLIWIGIWLRFLSQIPRIGIRAFRNLNGT